MRFKKQKRHRKTVRFFTACFGFHDPFKVLCDGTFVHHLITNSITPADTALANVLGAPVKLFTTRCILAELKSLGDSYNESLNAAHNLLTASDVKYSQESHNNSLNAAHNLLTARCDHEKRKSAVNCIADVIGENNSEHFFVATQDADLRKKLQEVPGVPLVFGLRNALFLEKPSAFQHQFVRSSEEARAHMTDREYKLLDMERKNVSSEELNNSSNEPEGSGNYAFSGQFIQANIRKNREDVKDKVQFKRKRAKGPNPLSCKKKKPRPITHNAVTRKDSSNTNTTDADTTKRSRSRKRKRSRKSNNVGEAAA